MSDRTFDDEGDSTVPAEFWWQAVERGINGPRGQAALAELEEALLALPRRRLIEEDISDGRDVCALGALALKRDRELCPRIPRREAIEYLHRSYGESGSLAIWECGMHLRLLQTVAWVISYANDDLAAGLTPEERWKYVMNWCRTMQGKPRLKRYEVHP